MSKALFALFALLCVSQAAFRVAIPDSNLAVSNDTKIVLETSNNRPGYSANVNFSATAESTSRVLFSLYSSMSFFTADSCLSFKTNFKCDADHHCERTPDYSDAHFPYATVGGSIVRTSAELDISNWKLNKYADTIVPSNCNGGQNTNLGSGSSGIIGLGFEGRAKRNFQNGTTNFSLYSNESNFILEFNSLLHPKKLITTIKTDSNWTVVNPLSIKMGSLTEMLDGYKVIFDVNFNGVGVPFSLYKVIHAHMNFKGFTCNDLPMPQYTGYPAGKVTCSYDGKFNKLPKILISTGRDTHITIAPEVYAESANAGSFTLKLIPLFEGTGDNNYVNKSFGKHIVLGNSFLREQYTLFNIETSSVSFYRK